MKEDKKAKKLKKHAAKLLDALKKSMEATKGETFKARLTGDEISQLLGCVTFKIDWNKSKPVDKKKAVNDERELEVTGLLQLQQRLLEVLAGK